MSDEVLDGDDMEIEVSDEPIPTLSELLEQTEVVAQPPVNRRPTTAASYVERLKQAKDVSQSILLLV